MMVNAMGFSPNFKSIYMRNGQYTAPQKASADEIIFKLKSVNYSDNERKTYEETFAENRKTLNNNEIEINLENKDNNIDINLENNNIKEKEKEIESIVLESESENPSS